MLGAGSRRLTWTYVRCRTGMSPPTHVSRFAQTAGCSAIELLRPARLLSHSAVWRRAIALATSESRRSRRAGTGRMIAFAGPDRRCRARLRNATHSAVLPRGGRLHRSDDAQAEPCGLMSDAALLLCRTSGCWFATNPDHELAVKCTRAPVASATFTDPSGGCAISRRQSRFCGRRGASVRVARALL
jgi:hypothetical protein